MEYQVINAKKTGAHIRQMRKERNLTVGDIASYMGFGSEQAIYKWQRGESLPTLDNIYALAALFGTTVDEILIGSREEDESPLLPFCA